MINIRLTLGNKNYFKISLGKACHCQYNGINDWILQIRHTKKTSVRLRKAMTQDLTNLNMLFPFPKLVFYLSTTWNLWICVRCRYEWSNKTKIWIDRWINNKTHFHTPLLSPCCSQKAYCFMMSYLPLGSGEESHRPFAFESTNASNIYIVFPLRIALGFMLSALYTYF